MFIIMVIILRDFTYIDDIIEGTCKVVEKPALQILIGIVIILILQLLAHPIESII